MSKPYRSVLFNDERKWKSTELRDDVYQVGIQKAMGYICLEEGESTEELDKRFSVKMTCFKPAGNGYGAPTYWVGDAPMIQAILDKNKELLDKNEWSCNAAYVFNRLSLYQVNHEYNKELYHMITDLFNSWCLWCEPMTEPVLLDGRSDFLSANLFDPDANG